MIRQRLGLSVACIATVVAAIAFASRRGEAADGEAPAGTKPLNVIFDTDIDGDNDDAAAVAILHAVADAGQVRILAMGVVSRCPQSPACLDAINTYYGRGDIPIGVYKGSTLAEMGSRYAKIVAERCPNDIGLSGQVPGVLPVYRRVLSSQPDGEVTMIAVGQMNNLIDLLATPPDEHSSLSGRELVQRKVAVLFVMAPYFNERNEFQRAYNFVSSPKAAVELIDKWPTRIKFAEGNLGHRHFIGGRLSEAPADHPVRIAFEAYFAAEKERSGTTDNKRHCADPTTVLYAVSGAKYFGEVGPGACDVREDGHTRWNAGRDRQHFYNTQKLSIAELELVMEDLLLKPPRRLQRAGEFEAELIFPLHPKHNHAPGIVECPNGDLIASWYRGSGERKADDVAVYGARRRSGGAAWSEPFVMADTPGFPDCNTALWIDRESRLWLFWPVILANTWQSCLTQYRVARDFSGDGPPRWDWQGSIFLAPDKMPEDLRAGFEEWKKIAGVRRFADFSKVEEVEKILTDKLFQRLGWQPRCKPTVLPSGRIVFPLYTDTFSVSVMALSDDGGRTWRSSRILAGIGNIQPAVLRRRDGSLVAYMRENGPLDRVRVAESLDEGETWGPVGTVDSLPNPGSGLDGIVLASGAWLLIHNDAAQGRKSLALSLSEDEGSTWRTARHLERSVEGSYHYPAIVQGRDGHIHAVYTYSTSEGSSMKHAAFSEAWLRSQTAAGAEPAWERCLAQPSEWYGSDAALGIAGNVASYQRASGGWPKNVDMARPLDAEALRKLEEESATKDATIDNGATHRQLAFLARVHTATGRKRHREAFERGLDLLLSAQGVAGGWRQRFEEGEAYQRHITFNDGAMAGVLELLRGVARGEPAFAFVDDKRRGDAALAVERGIACILKCQVVLDGRPTVWCAQHDEATLEPRPARSYEPAALSGGESAGIVSFLMGIERPGPEVVRAVEGALAWFEKTKIQGKRWKDGALVDDPAARPLWARFYEIPSLRPVFGDRDGSVHFSVEEISQERRTGYAWYGDWPRTLIEKDYPAWRKRLGR